METPRLAAPSRGATPEANNLRAASSLEGVILRWRPPTRPCDLAASSPARVRSMSSSRSIWASEAMTWKKKRPASTRSRTYGDPTWRPRRSSFHTTRVHVSVAPPQLVQHPRQPRSIAVATRTRFLDDLLAPRLPQSIPLQTQILFDRRTAGVADQHRALLLLSLPLLKTRGQDSKRETGFARGF